MDFLDGDYVLAKEYSEFEGYYKTETLYNDTCIIEKDKVYKIDRIIRNYYMINQHIFDEQDFKKYFCAKDEERRYKLEKLR
jgi:hypothetical protein